MRTATRMLVTTAIAMLLSANASAEEPNAQDSYCESLHHAFEVTLLLAPGHCQTKQDCSTYPGGVRPGDCGSITDRESATLLFGIYHIIQSQCGLAFNCAPRMIHWDCVNQHCIETSAP